MDSTEWDRVIGLDTIDSVENAQMVVEDLQTAMVQRMGEQTILADLQGHPMTQEEVVVTEDPLVDTMTDTIGTITLEDTTRRPLL